MPGQQTGDVRIYWFRPATMIWLLAPALLIAGVLWFCADALIFGPREAPSFSHPGCVGRACPGDYAIDTAAYLLMFIPSWIRLPVIALLAGEALTRLIVPVIWSFDRTPDFTIGPQGIYGPSGLRFYDVPWSDIRTATRRIYMTDVGQFFGLNFETTREVRPFGLLGLIKTKPLVIRLRLVHGFPLQEIVEEIKSQAPEMMIFTEEVDYRRRRSRW